MWLHIFIIGGNFISKGLSLTSYPVVSYNYSPVCVMLSHRDLKINVNRPRGTQWTVGYPACDSVYGECMSHISRY